MTTYISNINLKNSFVNKFSSSYNEVRNLGVTFFGGNFSYNTINNPIVPAAMVTPTGVYTYRYENMNGYNNNDYVFSGYYGRSIKKLDIRADFSGNVNGGTGYGKINNVVNKLTHNSYSLGVRLYKYKQSKYEIHFETTGGYTINQTSLQPEMKNNYFFYTITPTVNIWFAKKFQLHTDANYFWQAKTQAFNNNFRRVIWNTWLARHFFKNDRLLIKVSCNDILNENKGYTRKATNTFFLENRYTTIRRLFMISATWNFTRFNNIKQ